MGLIVLFLACIFCIIVLVVLVFGFLILLRLLRSRPYGAQETAQAKARASDFVSRTVPTLLPWQPGALADLAAHWEGTRGGFVIGEHQGVLKSLSNLDGPGLLACYLSLKGNQGFLLLCTPEHEVRLDIETDGANVAVEGQPLGSIHLREGTIFDSGGRPVGRYHRQRGLSPRYGPVELYGRTVAEVNDTLVRGGEFLLDGGARPLVRNLTPDLTPEEENWLLALVALELYHDAIRHRKRARSRHL